MKSQRMLLLLLGAIISLATIALEAGAQTNQPGKLYQGMTQAERASFVAEQSRRIARQMSGTEYEFTPAFETDIQRALEQYVRRIGNNDGDRLLKGDARFIFERGQRFAPTLMGVFKSRNVSPLIGLYIPWIESEYINLPPSNDHAGIGMFQFIQETGERYGLTTQELLDVEKSADAAARYITDRLNLYKDDPMKEALALLAYNRGERKTSRDLRSVLNEQNRRCSICALNAARDKLDETYREENAYYVPRFFAAAIIGENPQAFGLQQQPLSSYETKR